MFPSDTTFFAPPSTDYANLGFTGRLECVPHDMVHDSVGGWMGNVPSAAGDPLFFAHHCQIDRLYASWEAGSAVSYNWGSTSAQPDEQTWKGQLAYFVDENGNLVQVKLGDAIDTDALGYNYDNLASPPPPQVAAAIMQPAQRTASKLVLAAMQSGNFTVKGGGGAVTLAPATGTRPSGVSTNNPTTLVLEGIKLLRRPPAPLSVFLNLPKGTAPELNGPYYVGTLNLFNFDLGSGSFMSHVPGQGMAMPPNQVRFDVTEILQHQRATGLWGGGPVTVTIATIGADTPGNLVYMTVGSAMIVP